MKKLILCLLILCSTSFIFAQTILTASSYFQTVSDYYSTIKDYEAELVITDKTQTMTGHLSFKRPNLLRIDFSTPKTQVISFNGEILTIYLPGPDAALQQTVEKSNEASVSGTNLATPQGLYLLSRYYYVSYETSQTPVPFEEGSDEMVVNLLFTSKTASEGFKQIKISVSADTKLIRKVTATQAATNDIFDFEFYSYTINNDIPDERFIYDAPGSANVYSNFVFGE